MGVCADMNTSEQIVEINAQFAERVKLLEQERDAKVAIVRERCVHEPVKWFDAFIGEFVEHGDECKHCGAPMP